jgi:hypothetical protein
VEQELLGDHAPDVLCFFVAQNVADSAFDNNAIFVSISYQPG